MKSSWFKMAVVALAVSLAALGVQGESPSVQLWANGPYWAIWNVGATSPQDSGYYFWWGGTVGYTIGTYNMLCESCEGNRCNVCARQGYFIVNGWCPVTNKSWTVSLPRAYDFSLASSQAGQTCNKSCSQLKELGYIDDVSNPRLNAAHDAATKNWGSPWRMPTKDEISQLANTEVCTCVWTTVSGVYGRRVCGVTEGYKDKSIFIPAVGCGDGKYLDSSGLQGRLWSSEPDPDSPYKAYALRTYFADGHISSSSHLRYIGLPIRPVRDTE